MRYSGYIPEHVQTRPAEKQLDDLQGRLLGDYGIPQDFGDVAGAIIELTRIVANLELELSRALRGKADAA